MANTLKCIVNDFEHSLNYFQVVKSAFIDFFWSFWGSATSCKYNIEILSPNKVKMADMLAYLHIQQTWSNISIHLELCRWPPDEYKFNIHCLIYII